MSLRSPVFVPVMNTSEHELIRDFFIPALENSTTYDRGVGFFSASWLRIAASGMAAFAHNSGRARWVTSPILSEQDWEALELGDAARSDAILRKAILVNIDALERELQERTLSVLAWLVADGILEFKLALPRNKLERGDFHDKFGIFSDSEGNQISFNGSYNDSVQGIRNYESIKVFQSWESAFAPLVQADAERFERLWYNRDPNVQVFDLPQAAKAQIIQLRSQERPYREPDWEKLRKLCESRSAYRFNYIPVHPRLPTETTLRDYQEEAVAAWLAHDGHGLLEMATGTGKTITALAASAQIFEQQQRLAVIIAVPYQHLVDQWSEEARAFGYRPILAYQSKARWIDELNHQIIDFNSGYRDFISVIVTHTTFITSDFQNSIARLVGPALIIADEAHHLGAERGRQSYPEHIRYRLALSATPDRWFDDLGTALLRAYFGETVFALTLEEAIGLTLTEYYYYPHLVSLTDEEMEAYQELSLKIARMSRRDDEEGQRIFKMLLIKRADLLNQAKNKLPVLSELVDAEDHIEHTLFYCAPSQIDEVAKLLGWEKGLSIHKFTAEEDTKERQALLKGFATGEWQALVAMKCLDEGVDVPTTRTAFFLASSSNPREFIQRRGRILRKAPGKEFSIIHDLIAVPPSAWGASQDPATFESERSIVRRELGRFSEFAKVARNKHQALDVIWKIATRYGLRDL
ncbi:MAG: ATP-dependent RNA helicase DbpA [Chloroflexi bacterium ADurb.Bin360]|nr:MAG: ATP-dependent RNA helicase DbpA [Chloroflexi bacterium ADurb.Bin360]